MVLLDHKLDGFIEGSANYAPVVNVFAQFVGIRNNHLHCVFLKDSTASKLMNRVPRNNFIPDSSHFREEEEEEEPPHQETQPSLISGGNKDGRLPPRGRFTAIASGGPDKIQPRPKPGQQLKCKIIAPAEYGYNVVLTEYNLEGFLRSSAHYERRQVVLSEFISMQEKHAICNLIDLIDTENSYKLLPSNSTLEPGKPVFCQIIEPAECGYKVFLPEHNIQGLLQSRATCTGNPTITARFIGILDGLAICSL